MDYTKPLRHQFSNSVATRHMMSMWYVINSNSAYYKLTKDWFLQRLLQNRRQNVALMMIYIDYIKRLRL